MTERNYEKEYDALCSQFMDEAAHEASALAQPLSESHTAIQQNAYDQKWAEFWANNRPVASQI